ncbi:33 kDa chaperonin [Clostridia bacterium]|nr:33 kDa chaperonin [Clostridia bacterium]
METNDYLVRGVAAEGRIRAFAASTKQLIEEIRVRQKNSPIVTDALGRLLTAGVMMGAMLKEENSILTIKIRGDGPIGGLTVTANAKGEIKGYALNPQPDLTVQTKGKPDVASAVGIGVLTVIKDMGLKEPYSGSTILISSEIAEDVAYYFAHSEQIPSAVGLGVRVQENQMVDVAGGFIVQVMPGALEEEIAYVESEVAKVHSITQLLKEGMTPEQILESLLGKLHLEILEKQNLQFKCECSREKIEKVLRQLGKRTLQEMIDEGEMVEVGCDFCNQKYQYDIETIQKICDLI